VAQVDGPDEGSFGASEPLVDGPDEGRARSGRTALLVIGGVVGVLAMGYLLAVLTTINGIPDGTTVVGVEIGGLTEDEAVATLESSLAEQAVAPIKIVALDQEAEIDPVAVGLRPDFPATVESASGPVLNPVRLMKVITGQSVEVPPVVSYDSAAMDSKITDFALTADDPAVEPAIEMDPVEPRLTDGAVGQGVDQDASPAVIAEAYLYTQGPLPMPQTTLTPTVSDEEAQRVLQEFAVPSVSGPVTMTYESGSEELTVDAIVASLSFSAVEGTLQPQLNLQTLRAALPGLAAVEQPGKNATWDVSSGTPVVVPSSQGKGVTDEDLANATLAALPKTAAGERVAALTVTSTDPELTTEQAQALNINEKLSTFTQKFDYAEYRLIKVGQAAKYMNGTVLQPGDIYSMNETIKERTEANGYVSGTFISNGRFEQGLGGGVSIATTATWTAAFFAGLEAIEVNPHSLYISRYQPGLEATVAWGALDLRFRNNTGNGVLITTESGGTFITVTMWGTKVYEKIDDESSPKYDVQAFPTVTDTSADCEAQGGVNGFTIDVWRVFYQGGKQVDREKFTTQYDPTTRVVCAPPPQPAPAPPPAVAPGATPSG
jgi:vancomycin resistance protein YoaR